MNTTTIQTSKKINYGVDAPGVIRNIFIAAFISIILSLISFYIKTSLLGVKPSTFLSIGISCIFSGSFMLLYSLHGKYKYRDRLLNMINWTGKEQVLDIGTGRGLLMIGAAKRLTTGKSFGIDIWNQEDLTANNANNALQNAFLESVSDKVQVENQNVTCMAFNDQMFDVVVSNLCLHNIYNKEARFKACAEIYRVLKPGGTVIISDFRHTNEYQRALTDLGMNVELKTTEYFNTFPPLTVIKAVK